MTALIVADIGGTHARFALAQTHNGGQPSIGRPRKYRVADFPDLPSCWARFCAEEEAGGDSMPRDAVIAFAAPIRGGVVKLTNSHWTVGTYTRAALGLRSLRIVNDFEAVAHGVAALPPSALPLLMGPDMAMPTNGAVTIMGIGTGLGTAAILFKDGVAHIAPAEGGRTDYAAVDGVDDMIVGYLRARIGRAPVERMVAGPALELIHAALTGKPVDAPAMTREETAALWDAAIDSSDSHARHALDRLMMALGTAAGNLALTHCATTLVLTGDLTRRIAQTLPQSGFHARFVAKDPYEWLLREIPIRIALHDEIGLYGAAAAFRETD